MKHAYLILAHTDWAILKTLLSCIDDERNDIFVHIDAKVKNMPDLETKKASLFVLKDRVDVYWGDLSVVEAEYKLFEAAASNDEYAYYHLLSGSDLPLKSQDYIHSFFNLNRKREFIGFSTYDCRDEVLRKVGRWHLFPKDFKNKSTLKRVLRAAFLRFQAFFGIQRNRKEKFRKGTQWVSVTDGFVRSMIDAKPWVMKTFTHTFCPDEIYKQTLCWTSGYRQWIYDSSDEGNGCMRAIGWKDGCLHDWTAEDYDTLVASGALFARKFNSSDMAFINKIAELSK